jgi:hypothetical protein
VQVGEDHLKAEGGVEKSTISGKPPVSARATPDWAWLQIDQF